jgi:LL-diaminopimelate aminotransferase
MNFETAERLSHISEYYFSSKLRQIDLLNISGPPVINLGIGSPDLMPDPSVIEVLKTESEKKENHRYQNYKGIPQLRDAFSFWYEKYFKVALNPENEILPLIGSKEGIIHVSMTYLDPGDDVLVPDPGYPAYRASAYLAGATVRPYDLEEKGNWLPDLDQLGKQDLSKVKIMWLNYPHMPSGAQADLNFFRDLVSFAKQHQILLCHDNPYSFILSDASLSLLSADKDKSVTLELNSLSKSFNMAGWRVGVLVSNQQIVKDVLKFKSNVDSGMFKPVQLAAARALSLSEDWYKELNKVYSKRKALVIRLAEALNCEVCKGQAGMFVWCRIPVSFQDGIAFSDYILNQARVFVTPGNIFGQNGNKYIRISLCSDELLLQTAVERCTEMTKKQK